MKKTYLKKISKYIRLFILIGFILTLQQVCIPKAETKVTNGNLNKTLDLHAMALKLDEIIQSDLYNPVDTFNGEITGYAADCELCGGTLGCTGQNVLTDRTTTYNDRDYGLVKIVASSQNLPCGSIVEFNLSSFSDEKITAIVLDRGVVGTALDLLVEDEQIAVSKIGRQHITYNILRFGYAKEN